MGKWFRLILLLSGLALYTVSLVLFAKLQYDSGFACMLGASVLLIAWFVLTMVRLYRNRKKK